MAGVGRKKIYKRLRNKFRLVILNDDTFEEKFSLVLSPFNLFTWGGLAVILTAAIVFALIAFTPLSELIPGYGDETTKKLAIATTLKADSIEQKLKPTEAYLTNLAYILKGKVNDSVEEIKQDSAKDYSEINLDPSKEDSMFRQEMEAKTEYNLMFKNKAGVTDAGSYFFFTPLNGPVTS
ncbi:MAG: M23 family peptidase, partial [Flavobacteriales bacterium]